MEKSGAGGSITNFRANHIMGSIANANALDMQITGTDRFCYIVTYSFPCQDLSVAGRRKGMAKGGGNLEPKVIVPVHGGQAPARYRIRKLTPLECWRLMGFSDVDFHKAEAANSNSQLYKQAGNSIVKDVLMAIFRQMLPEGGQGKEEREDEQGTGTGSHAGHGEEERLK